MAEHSKTPWHHDGYPIWSADKQVVCLIADVDYFGHLRDVPNYEANAAFIVTACNSHAALLAACKAARNVIERLTNGKTLHGDAPEVQAYLMTDAAIRLAETGAAEPTEG